MTFRILSIISLALLLTACEDKDLPKLKGRYQGFITTGLVKTQVIAQIPDYTTVGKSKVVIFKIYSTLASAVGEQYILTILDKGSVELKAPQISSGSALLSINKTCAAGGTGLQNISICWDEGKLNLSIDDNSDPEKSITISLNLDNSLPPAATNKVFSLDELAGRAKYINYSVSQEAERVFQAKQNIGVARGNLLPKLNLKSLLGLVTGDYPSAIGSVLPFLFPGNWYKWEASKELYKAEKTSFASLRGNEMNMVEGLYYLILRDQIVLERLKTHIVWMKQIQNSIHSAEKAGTIPQGSADYFGTSIALLEKDRINFEVLIKIEYGQLAQATALPPLNGITGLMPVNAPDLASISPIDPSAFYKYAQEKSFEIKSLGFLLEAAKYSQKEIYFNFFDLEGTNGIGFGTPYQIRVSKSQQNEIRKKTDETMSLIELQSSIVAGEYNSALESHQLALSGRKASEKRLTWIVNRMLQGDGIDDGEEFVNQLTDVQYKIVNFIADQATSTQMWLMANAKQNRLLLNGYYSDLEAALPEEPAPKSNNNNAFTGVRN